MRLLALLISCMCFTYFVHARSEHENFPQGDGVNTILGLLQKDAKLWKELFEKIDAMSSQIERLSCHVELTRSIEELRNQCTGNQVMDSTTELNQPPVDMWSSSIANQEMDSTAKLNQTPIEPWSGSPSTVEDSLRALRVELNTSQSAILNHLQEYRKEFQERHHIQESMLSKSFSYGREWVEIFRNTDGEFNFLNRKWQDYKSPGGVNGAYFIGLDHLYVRTTYEAAQELLIILTDLFDQVRYAKYDLFQIGDEDQQYAIVKLGNYMGNAGDVLRPHLYRKFSTYDRDNDENDEINCARIYRTGWWFFGNCTSFLKLGLMPNTYRGSWSRGLKSVVMKIRSTLLG
ncbi:uncharacterized protein LOC101897189 [Musca domestica]|uniref:Uncharacterized protein LOC101897189 n=1 Tax=Musca domestica TaxID=7370 RepID=A0A9J7D988_MUSDO|nr:uncharacterized protein LOC101897189 [Musca domestica]